MRRLLLGIGLAAAPGLANAQPPVPVPVPVPAPDAATAGAAAPATIGAVARHARQTPPAAATPDADSDADAESTQDIVVTGQREPGQVIGDIAPEEQLSPADVRSYGVSSIGDLITELAPELESGRGSGPPVILLSGRRISSFSEIRQLPTEAILRVDILPEEVALKYGYTADQKVVNIVLRQRFHAHTLEARDAQATDGGHNTPHGSYGFLNINPKGRFSLDLDYQESPRLLESQRDVTSLDDPAAYAIGGNIVPANGATQIDPGLSVLAGGPVTIAGVPAGAANGAIALGDFAATAGVPNATDLRPYRTLLSASSDFTANSTLERTILGGVDATLNGSVEIADSTSEQGLPTIGVVLPAGNPYSPFSQPVVLDRYLASGTPLEQSGRTVTSHAGTTFNGDIGRWRWTLTGTYDRVDARTFTETGVDASALQAALDADDPAVNPFGPLGAPLIGAAPANIALSTSQTGEADALATGTLFDLPAGGISTSVKVGGQLNDFTSRSFRDLVETDGRVRRNIANGQLNLDLPLTSRSRGVLGAVGDLSANVNAAINQLSDFGTLTTLGYGADWTPITPIHLLVSWTHEDNAPSADQLGDPTVVTPNTRVFDYVTGTTVDVTRTTGGNPLLDENHRHVFKAELNAKPFSAIDLRLTASYVDTRIRDAIASFPAATAAIEDAFPDRFTRDAAGTLIAEDARPVNFDEEDTRELRWGFNFSKPLKSKVQREIEAFRNGTGPNPFAALRAAYGGRGRHGGQDGRDGQTPAATGTTPDGGAAPTPSTQSAGQQTATAPAANGAPPADGTGNGGGEHRGYGGGGGGGWHGRGGGGGAFGGGGRLQFAIYDTWHFTDRITIRPGVPTLDLLNGDAIGDSGGQPRHQVEVQAGYVNNGIGARLSGNYQTATDVTSADGDDLHFGSLATFNLRLFANLGSRLDFVAKHPWARGMRITLAANNLFNTRQHVHDATGDTPVEYEPDYLDPLGRTVMISVRKLFYSRSAQ